jgi:hypothetical protein
MAAGDGEAVGSSLALTLVSSGAPPVKMKAPTRVAVFSDPFRIVDSARAAA